MKKNKIKDKPTDDGIYVTYKLASTKGYKLGDKVLRPTLVNVAVEE